MNHGLTLIVFLFYLVQTSFKEFGGGGFEQVHLGFIRFLQKLVRILAKRRLCLGPTGVINCTPLSALSF